MKKEAMTIVSSTAALLILLSAGVVLAATMVIRLQDGTTVSYDTAQVASVTFSEGAHSRSAGGAPLFVEEFSDGLSSLWEPIQVVGGNFERFAAIVNGKLTVSVPAGNSWGKTGIMSRNPLFSVDANMAANPLRVSFEFDPAGTTGYIIALSQAKDPDVWRVQNAWFHWGKPTLIEGKAYLVNTQNNGDKGGETRTSGQAPGNVTLAVRPGGVEATMPNGSRISAQISWLKAGVPVYLYVFSHPWNQHEAAALTLKAIRITQ